jgi:hypothetical protein
MVINELPQSAGQSICLGSPNSWNVLDGKLQKTFRIVKVWLIVEEHLLVENRFDDSDKVFVICREPPEISI